MQRTKSVVRKEGQKQSCNEPAIRRQTACSSGTQTWAWWCSWSLTNPSWEDVPVRTAPPGTGAAALTLHSGLAGFKGHAEFPRWEQERGNVYIFHSLQKIIKSTCASSPLSPFTFCSRSFLSNKIKRASKGNNKIVFSPLVSFLLQHVDAPDN